MRIRTVREGEITDAWNALLASDPQATPFQTPEWYASWRNRGSFLLGAYLGRDLVGIWPLYRYPWGISNAIGPADYRHPVIEPEVRGLAIGEILAYLAGSGFIYLQELPDSSGLADSGHEPQSTCRAIELTGTYADFERQLSKSLRTDLRRGPGTWRSADDLGVLLDLHRKRWHARRQPGAFFLNSHRHQAWAAAAQARGWLRVGVWEIEGEPAAATYGLRYGNRHFHYQAGMDPRFARWSPGSLAIGAAIRRTYAEEVEIFDLLRGDEAYKRRWKPTLATVNRRRTLGPAPAMVRGVVRWGERIEDWARRRWEAA